MLAEVVGKEQEGERQEGGQDHDHVERLLELAREGFEVEGVCARVELEEDGVGGLRGHKRATNEGEDEHVRCGGTRRVPEHAAAGRVEGREARARAPVEQPAHERVVRARRRVDAVRAVAADTLDSRPEGGVDLRAAQVRGDWARACGACHEQQGENPHAQVAGLLYIAHPSFVLQLCVAVARAEVVIAAVRRVVHDADVLLGRVVEMAAIRGQQDGRQEHGEHDQQPGEKEAVARDPLECSVEDGRARHVPAQVRVLEEVRQRREPSVAARMGLDLVAEVGVVLHVGVELRLLALLPQPRLLAAALVFAVERVGEHLDARHDEPNAREHDGAGGHKRARPLDYVGVSVAAVAKHERITIIDYIISGDITVPRYKLSVYKYKSKFACPAFKMT